MNDHEMTHVDGDRPKPEVSVEPSLESDFWPDFEPMVERPPLAPVRPSRRSRMSRTALITASVTALAVSVAVAVAADPTASPSTGATATDPATVPATVTVEAGTDVEGGWMIGEFPDGRGTFGGHFGGPFEVSIAAIDGSSLDLATDNGWTRTIDTTDVPITRSGVEITLADLAVGDSIRLMEERRVDGDWSVIGIAVVLPHVAGTVASVSDDTLTITEPDGSTQDVMLTADTAYTLGESDGTRADVTAGLKVMVEGTPAGDRFTAAAVHVAPAFIGGTVTATSADSITIDQRDGTTATINVDSSTEYAVRGAADSTLADVAVGDLVVATGRLADDGSLAATRVFSGVSFGDGRGPGGHPGFGPGGPGGHGHFGGPGWGPGDPSQIDPNTDPDATDDSST